MSWTTKPSWPAGHEVTADEAAAVLNQIDSLTAPGWTDYSSTLSWTCSGTAPALGNATKIAEYRRAADSDMVEARIKITFGSTSTYGTGVFFFNLPVIAATNSLVWMQGWAYALDTGVQEYGGLCKIEAGGDKFRVLPASNNTDNVNNWSSAAPFAFGSGDIVAFFLRYQGT